MACDDKSISHHRSSPSSSHLVLVSFPFSFLRLVVRLVFAISRLVPASRPSISFLILCVSYPSSRLSSRFRYRHQSPCLIHLISYRCHLATNQTPISANADKNELNKTVRPYRPAPPSQSKIREQNATTTTSHNDKRTPSPPPTTPLRPTRTASPTRMATRAKRDGDENETKRRDETRDGGTRRDAHNEMLPT